MVVWKWGIVVCDEEIEIDNRSSGIYNGKTFLPTDTETLCNFHENPFRWSSNPSDFIVFHFAPLQEINISCLVCTKNQGKRGEKRSSRSYGFFLYSLRHSSFTKKMENYFPFLSCTVFFANKGKIKNKFPYATSKSLSRGRKSCENKVFWFRVVCVPLSCWLQPSSTCR